MKRIAARSFLISVAGCDRADAEYWTVEQSVPRAGICGMTHVAR